jgi:ribosomal-protein-alanine N-acetyltransferase
MNALAALTKVSGKQTYLQPFAATDITPEYIAWLNDPLVVRYSNQRFIRHTEASCQRYFGSFSGSPNLFLSIRMKEDDLAVGTMTAYIAPHHGTADIGIMIGRSSVWGRGVGQDAWNTLLGWLVGQPGIRKITAGAMSSNISMIKIMEKSGMQHEATRARQELLDGEPQDLLYFARFP